MNGCRTKYFAIIHLCILRQLINCIFWMDRFFFTLQVSFRMKFLSRLKSNPDRFYYNGLQTLCLIISFRFFQNHLRYVKSYSKPIHSRFARHKIVIMYGLNRSTRFIKLMTWSCLNIYVCGVWININIAWYCSFL